METFFLILCAVALVVVSVLMLAYRSEARGASLVANQITASFCEEQAELERVRSEKARVATELQDTKRRITEVQARLAASESNIARLNDDLGAQLAKAQSEEASRGEVCGYVFASGERCRVPALLHTHHLTGHGEDARVTIIRHAASQPASA